MSISSEYEWIRRELGEKAYADLEVYLKFHPHVMLSDLYYNQQYWEDCQQWLQTTPGYFKNSEPIYCVEGADIGITGDFNFNECRFLGTKEEIEQKLGFEEDAMDEVFLLNRGVDKYFVSGESNFMQEIRGFPYTVFVSHSPDSLKRFINNEDYCIQEDIVIKPDREFDMYSCGQKGLVVAKGILEAERNNKKKLSLSDQIRSAEKKSAGQQSQRTNAKEYDR